MKRSLFLFCLFALSTRADEASLTTEALVNASLAQHPELKFYEAELAAAKSGVRAASSLPTPEVAIDVGQKRVRDAAGALVGDGTVWSVSVTQTFEWHGRLALRQAIANRQLDLAQLGLGRFRGELALRVRTLAFGLNAAVQRAAAVREVAERFTALKETFLAREPGGITPQLETRVIEAAELALQRRATDAELAVHAALLELNQLRGAAPAAPLKLTAPVLSFHDAPATDALLAAARENNFPYRARRADLAQQALAVRLAENERRPAVSVRPYFAQENAGGRGTTIGLGVSMPLPGGTRARSAVDVAEARRVQAEAAEFVAQRELERTVLTAAQTFSAKLAELRRQPADAAQKFRDAAALADRHYRLGAVPVATYVELQQSYLDAVEALLETERDALTAGLQLQQLTGLDLRAADTAP